MILSCISPFSNYSSNMDFDRRAITAMCQKSIGIRSFDNYILQKNMSADKYILDFWNTNYLI